MQYIRLQTALLDDPKFIDLCDYLQDLGQKFTRRDVFGSITLLWLKAARHFNHGEIHDEHDLVRRLAKHCEWHGDPKIWAEGLLHFHWIDKSKNEKGEEGFYIHNWMDKHAREWWLKNEDAERKRKLARDRAARFRNSRKKAVEILREKGINYDESPPL